MAKTTGKRGLVLQGGGAKGAYQFGCLLAFAERGVTFDAVAGTSVGALNAFLWSSGSLREGEELYRNLSQDDIYPFRLSGVFGKLRAVLTGLAHGIRYTLDGARLSPSVRSAVSVGFVLPYLCLALWYVLRFMPFSWGTIYLLVGIFGSAYVAHRHGEDRDVGTIYCHFLPAYIMAALIAWGALLFARDKLAADMQSFMIAAAVVSSAILGLALSTVLLWKSTSLKAEPLRATIERLASRTVRVPTYATVAVVAKRFDRTNPTWQPRSIDDQGPRTPLEALEVRARYIDLQDRGADGRVEIPLASAALPFGLVPSVSVDGKTCVDGGVADNAPLLPLVDYENCDEVVVIALNPEDSERNLTVKPDGPACASVEHPPGREKNAGPKVRKSVRKLVLKPEKSLGSFVSGTMNFSRAYANRLITQGHQDARHMIENGALGRSQAS